MAKVKHQQKIVDAACAVAACEAWQFVSYHDIALQAGLNVGEVTSVFPQKKKLLHYIVRELDRSVLDDYCVDVHSSKRDNLFDVLMERFEAMNENRDAHISFIKSFGWNNCEKFSDMNFYFSTLENYMRAAHVETRGLEGLANVLALGAGYGYVLTIWMRDESADLIKTMAALDKTLSRLEWLKGYVRSSRSAV